MKEIKKPVIQCAGLFLLSLSLWGCVQSYPANRVSESIKEICRKEYGIENLEVTVSENTVGVFLPLKQLFSDQMKEMLLTGKVKDLERLFQPSPEVLEQVEDVLFSISRVLLSTDLRPQFYILQATDVENTGLQLVLIGYVDDIRRVRLWDISRNEYRKRILHDIRLNRAVVWHRPVRSFFETLENSPSLQTVEGHFLGPISFEVFRFLFRIDLLVPGDKSAEWRLGELRSQATGSTRVLVYTPVTVDYDPNAVPSGAFLMRPGTSLEYLFVISFAAEEPKISRVIPLFSVDSTGQIQKIPAAEEWELRKDLESWEKEFQVKSIRLGDFLADQLTRRTQALVFADERIQNTFEEVRLTFHYRDRLEEKFFSLDLDVRLKAATTWASAATFLQEDVLYFLNLASREFVNVLRSYQFTDYDFLELKMASDPASRILAREDLELLRRNKADLGGLLKGFSPV